MKKVLCIVLILFIFILFCSCKSLNSGIKVIVDGSEISFSEDVGFPHLNEHNDLLIPLKVVMKKN